VICWSTTTPRPARSACRYSGDHSDADDASGSLLGVFVVVNGSSAAAAFLDG